MTYKKSDIWSVMRKSVQKEEILRMKNYKILISDSTVPFSTFTFSRNCPKIEKKSHFFEKISENFRDFREKFPR